MSNPEERFSVRIKQRGTGAWAGVSYHPTKRAALEVTSKTVSTFVWAVFYGRSKVVDCRDWSGDIDLECQEEVCSDRLSGLLIAALAVLVLTPKTRDHLEANDPKGLEQALDALKAAGFDRDPHVSLEPCRDNPSRYEVLSK